MLSHWDFKCHKGIAKCGERKS